MRKQFLRYIFILMFIIGGAQCAYSQVYGSIGIHYSPPVKLDYCCNERIKIEPRIVPSYTLSASYFWKNRNKKDWYAEFGLATIGLSIGIENYLNDSTSAWINYKVKHIGFPSLILGLGRAINLEQDEVNSTKIWIGLESSFRIQHDLQEIRSYSFRLGQSLDDFTFPLFLRLNLGLERSFTMFKQIPVKAKFFSKISTQEIARSPEYLINPVSGMADTGKYSLNNSILGFQLSIGLRKTARHNPIGRASKLHGESKLRYLSFETQVFRPEPTKYFVPLVDSFSLEGITLSLTNQWSFSADFSVRGIDEKLYLSTSLGLGVMRYTNHFVAIPEFTTLERLIDSPNGGYLNIYGILGVGVKYEKPIRKVLFSNSISGVVVSPLAKEQEYITIHENPLQLHPPTLENALLAGTIDYDYGRDKFLVGVEYRPELLIPFRPKVALGVGAVFNITSGVFAQGRVKVSNGRTTYYGGLIQKFSKIGLSFRLRYQMQ